LENRRSFRLVVVEICVAGDAKAGKKRMHIRCVRMVLPLTVLAIVAAMCMECQACKARPVFSPDDVSRFYKQQQTQPSNGTENGVLSPCPACGKTAVAEVTEITSSRMVKVVQ
jgi:hypothetical protein